jgi:hypothetical protein
LAHLADAKQAGQRRPVNWFRRVLGPVTAAATASFITLAVYLLPEKGADVGVLLLMACVPAFVTWRFARGRPLGKNLGERPADLKFLDG